MLQRCGDRKYQLALIDGACWVPDDHSLCGSQTHQQRDCPKDLKDILKQRLERIKKIQHHLTVAAIMMTKCVWLLKVVTVTHSFELTVGFGLSWMSHFFIERRRMPVLQLMMWLMVWLFCKANAEVSFLVPFNKYPMNLSCEREKQTAFNVPWQLQWCNTFHGLSKAKVPTLLSSVGSPAVVSIRRSSSSAFCLRKTALMNFEV